MSKKHIPFLLAAGLLLTSCGGNPSVQTGKLHVVVSTTIVGDVAAAVGGDLIELTVLFPPGTDPHSFVPRPQDLAAIAEAGVIVINGLGLEEALEPSLEDNATGTIVHASDGIGVLEFEAHEGEEYEPLDSDPHTWMDPNNVIVWAENITAALAGADPANAAAYRANTDAYIASLRELDAWIRAELAAIPVERRLLVTDHLIFGYFADEYGLDQAGALIESFSASASPSAQELAGLEDDIRALDVPAIFVGNTINPGLAEQVAEDTGTQLVFIYTGSLSAPGGEADSYLKFMRYNVNAIVDALKD